MEFIYLVVTIVWLFWIFFYKKGNYTFRLAFILFLTSALFAVLNLSIVAEQIMRISFIGWIIGIVNALIEHRKLNNYHDE